MDHQREHLYKSARTTNESARSLPDASKIFREHLRRELSDVSCASDAANSWYVPCGPASAKNGSRSRDVVLGKSSHNDSSSLSSTPGGRDLVFESACSADAIIFQVAKLRLKATKRCADKEFLARNFTDVDLQRLATELSEITPPRRSWRHRPYRYKSLNGSELTFAALLAEMRKGFRNSAANAPEWCHKLRAFVGTVQESLTHTSEFRFNSPRIIVQHKSGNEYRALSLFGLADRVIDRIAARYLRYKFDRLLSPSARAFRCRSMRNPSPEHHGAVEEMHDERRARSSRPVWAAECDLKKFFDCIDQSIAAAAFRAACTTLSELGDPVDGRACQIFYAHLQCYSFQNDVLGHAPTLLQNAGPGASFCWPIAELAAFHDEAFADRRIGVPQGMALSGVDANLVLSLADFAVEEVATVAKVRVKYWRFCDDMLLLADTKKACERVFEAYLSAVKVLRLPAHPPQSVDAVKTVLKSKLPYPWADPAVYPGSVEHVSFVGHNMRHDGHVDVRPSSQKKYFRKHRLFIRLLRNRIFSGTLRISPERFLRNYENRLLRAATPHFRKKKGAETTNRCWVRGFRSKIGRGDERALQARALDRMRGQHLASIRILLCKIYGRSISLPKKSAGQRYIESYHRAFRNP